MTTSYANSRSNAGGRIKRKRTGARKLMLTGKWQHQMAILRTATVLQIYTAPMAWSDVRHIGILKIMCEARNEYAFITSIKIFKICRYIYQY